MRQWKQKKSLIWYKAVSVWIHTHTQKKKLVNYVTYDHMFKKDQTRKG